MERKNIGYYISKGKCLKVYAVKKMNKRTKRMRVVKVNYKGKSLKKGTKVYKKKADCMKKLKSMMKKKSSTKKPKKVKATKRTKFGKVCNYAVPYFGTMVPSISKFASGTPDTGITSCAWMWPTPPGALKYDRQQGGWLKK